MSSRSPLPGLLPGLLALALTACQSTTTRASPPVCAASRAPITVYAGATPVGGGGWWIVGGDDDFGPYEDGAESDPPVIDDGTSADPNGDPSGDPNSDPSADPGSDPSADPGASGDGTTDDGAGDSTTLALHPRTYASGCFTCAIVCTTDADPLVTTGKSASSTAAACRAAQRRLAAYAPGRLVACSRPPSGFASATPTVVVR